MGAAGPRARPRGCAEPGTGEGRAVTGVRGPGLARGAGWCPQTSAAARSRESLLFGLNGNTCPAANVVLTQLSRDAGHCKQGQNRGMGQGQPSSALRRPLAPPCAPRRGSSPPPAQQNHPGHGPPVPGHHRFLQLGVAQGGRGQGTCTDCSSQPHACIHGTGWHCCVCPLAALLRAPVAAGRAQPQGGGGCKAFACCSELSRGAGGCGEMGASPQSLPHEAFPRKHEPKQTVTHSLATWFM